MFPEIPEHVYVINLPERQDRRREMARELARIGLAFDSPRVTLFPALRPADAGDFPSIGAKGCFLSHLGVLRDARSQGYGTFLLLEDDAAFKKDFVTDVTGVLGSLAVELWCIAYLGYSLSEKPVNNSQDFASWRRIEPSVATRLTHAMMFRKPILEALVPYLERMLERTGGHAEGGPMHVDGAYSWFRRDHPDCITLLPNEALVVQRPSRSDISPTEWKERIPAIGLLRRAKAIIGK